ncbi:MAG: hypothetical protein ACFE9R_18890 [Candidatus Hermodarchaeota archaeon]
MEKTKKYIIIGIVGISCFSLLIFVNSTLFNDQNSPFIPKQGDRTEKLYSVENLTLFIDYSGVKLNQLFENVSLTNFQTSVYHLLLNCCDISIKQYAGFIYVNGINGVGTGWIYTVNDGTPPSIPSDYFYLLDNDTVKWKHVL